MKIMKIALLILAIAAALYVLIPSLSWGEDGAAVYKANYSAFLSIRIPARFAPETGSNLGVNARREVEAAGNAKKP